MDQYHLFWGGPFSQWAKSPFTLGSFRFNTAEQAMMFFKAVVFRDMDTGRKILAENNPRKQKALGRQVRGYEDVVWRSRSLAIVYAANFAKFTQNPDLLRVMLEIPATVCFVEASPHDAIWGIGLSAQDPRAQDKTQWLGENCLGQTLTQVRDYLLDPLDRDAFARHGCHMETIRTLISLSAETQGARV